MTFHPEAIEDKNDCVGVLAENYFSYFELNLYNMKNTG